MTGLDVLPTAIVYSVADVMSLRDYDGRIARIVCLSADAEVSLRHADVPVETAHALMDARGHRRAIARVRRAGRDLERALLNDIPLCAAASATLRHDLYFVASVAIRFWILIGKKGPWVYRRNDKWIVDTTRLAAVTGLMAAFKSGYPPYRDMVGEPPLPFLARRLNRLAARLVGRRRPVLVTAFLYGINALRQSAERQGRSMVAIRGTRPRWQDLFGAVITITKECFGRHATGILAVPRLDTDAEHIAQRALSHVKDPVVQAGLKVWQDTIAEQAAYTAGLVSEMHETVRLAKAPSVLGHSFKWSDEVALAEGAGLAGSWRLLASHGTHTLQQDPFAFEEHRNLANGMLISDVIDATLTQSPYADKLSRTLMPTLRTIRSKPIIWGYKKMSAPQVSPGTRLKLLHAGTYKSMLGPRTMLFESSSEYLMGLRHLVEAVGKVGNTDLVIRVRPRPECNLDTIRQALPDNGCWTLKTDGAFLDDLAAADALVSYSSTTIEEALHAQRPVILWGGANNYRHIEPETGREKATVFAPQSKVQLIEVLRELLTTDQLRKLTEEDFSHHVNAVNAVDAEEVLELLFVGGPKTDRPSGTVSA